MKVFVFVLTVCMLLAVENTARAITFGSPVRGAIPTTTYFHPPIGDRVADIQKGLKTELYGGHQTTVFPGNYTCNGVLYDKWYVYTDFNTNRTYNNGCYTGSNPDCGDYHPGEDWNGSGGSNTDAGQPVYAVGRGIIFAKGWVNGFGNVVMTLRKLLSGEIVISFFGHLQSIVNLPLLSEVSNNTVVGYVGNTDTGAAHLHWEVRRENMLNIELDSQGRSEYDIISISTTCGAGCWPGTNTNFISSHYYDPSDFVKNHSAIGQYSENYESTEQTTPFSDAYGQTNYNIGWPHDNGGGVFVHKWESNTDPRYRVWLQDFVDENNKHTALVLNEYDNENKVYLLQHGFRNLYMNNDGPYNYGLPFTNEIIHGYANSPDSTSGDAIQPGSYITVQKFRQVYEENGELVYNNHRKTMVWQDDIEAQHFPVGAFTIYACNEFQNGKQIYVINNKYPLDPFMDIPWPVEGVVMQNGTTGEWFTKVGSYNFVIHNPDGSRKQGTGLSVLITEGNLQFAGDASSNHSLPPPTGFRFAN